MASLVKRPGSAQPWQVRYRDHTGRSRSQQFTVKADADAFKLDVERAAQTGRLDLLDAGTQTLTQVGAQWFALHKGDVDAATSKGDAYIWNAVVEGQPNKGARNVYPRAEIADMEVRSIRRSHVQAFKVACANATPPVPASSVARALSLIARTLDFAADDGMIAANPALGVRPPRPPRRPDVYVVTPKQVEALRAAMPTSLDAAIVSVMAYAGLRPGELRALEKRHVGTKTLRVEAQCGEDGALKPIKSGGPKRNVPLCSALRNDLVALDWNSGLLLRNAHGGAWTKTDWANWRKRRFEPAATEAKVPIKKPYDLRHSIASLWIREGLDRVTIADWLGHSVKVLDDHYTHLFADLKPSDRRTVDAMIADARRRRSK